MTSFLPDSDSEDELPPNWEERTTLDGSVYYVDLSKKTSQWTHPRTRRKKRVFGDLPVGWLRFVDEDGQILYVQESTQRKTFIDPRLAFAVEVVEENMAVRQKYDGSSTALHILHGIDLSGKVFVITGATSGIGFETARSLALHGGEIVLCGRSTTTCEAARDKILAEKSTAKLFLLPMELTDLEDVKRAADTLRQQYSKIDVLILNAGVIGVGWKLTKDGLDLMFQVNCLSQLYFTLLIHQLIVEKGRIVILSSESHRQSLLNANNITPEKLSPPTGSGHWDIMAYNNSKLCNILHGLILSKKLADRKIDVFPLHPGNMMSTGLGRTSRFYRVLFALVRPFTKSMQQGAATTVLCAVSPDLEGHSGTYFNNCCPTATTSAARDEKLAEKLWDISIEMLSKRMSDVPKL